MRDELSSYPGTFLIASMNGFMIFTIQSLLIEIVINVAQIAERIQSRQTLAGSECTA